MKFNIYKFALGFVFLIFGIWQIIQPNYWTSYLPLWTKNFNQEILMRINGIFNLFVGISFTLGFYLLIFSGLAILHLIGVIFTLGIFNDIAIRDIGLLILAIGIFLEEVRKSDKIKLLIKKYNLYKKFLKFLYG
jgi:uncharacterized protein YjeT (DUF2065 family)